MHTLKADFEIVETSEKFTLTGTDIKGMIDRARKEAGEWVTIAVRAVAVLSFVVAWTTGTIDLQSAGQTHAPITIDENSTPLNWGINQ